MGLFTIFLFESDNNIKNDVTLTSLAEQKERDFEVITIPSFRNKLSLLRSKKQNSLWKFLNHITFSGKYVIFLDAGNALAPNALQILKDNIEYEPRANIIHFGSIVSSEEISQELCLELEKRLNVPVPDLKDDFTLFASYNENNLFPQDTILSLRAIKAKTLTKTLQNFPKKIPTAFEKDVLLYLCTLFATYSISIRKPLIFMDASIIKEHYNKRTVFADLNATLVMLQTSFQQNEQSSINVFEIRLFEKILYSLFSDSDKKDNIKLVKNYLQKTNNTELLYTVSTIIAKNAYKTYMQENTFLNAQNCAFLLALLYNRYRELGSMHNDFLGNLYFTQKHYNGCTNIIYEKPLTLYDEALSPVWFDFVEGKEIKPVVFNGKNLNSNQNILNKLLKSQNTKIFYDIIILNSQLLSKEERIVLEKLDDFKQRITLIEGLPNLETLLPIYEQDVVEKIGGIE